MAIIKNARDSVLQVTNPRLLSSPLNYISLVPTSNTISNILGAASPSSITVRGTLNGVLRGTLSWSLSPSVAYSVVSDGISITSTNIPVGTSVTVIASLTYLGNVYTSSTIITRKETVTLNSNGSLSGEGGGSITNLDYSNVGGTKPPSNATSNFFTTSTNDPVGGTDGDAHFNSLTNVMWFKTSGTWNRGGTIDASEITVGTLAAGRIAANSITGDKISSGTITGSNIAGTTITGGNIATGTITATNIAASTITGSKIAAGTITGTNIAALTITSGHISVTTLSAIKADLGTVTAGNITGTANIDIAGSAKFAGLNLDAGVYYTALFNTSRNASAGLKGYAGSGGVGIYGDSGAGGDRGTVGAGRDAGSTGVQAVNTGGGRALSVEGYMTTTSNSLVANLYSESAKQLKGQISNNLTFQRGVLTGSATATFIGTNKPGSSNSNSWIEIKVDGGTFYIPVWA